ncbi:family 43 glycosylhydrolase [Paenibacillus hamazuiensis]|uniref:family 43 glycosylhydrolase n=1 Tax=Paenibacillus hamazuiensis TaxID=2936508 RepID=UPI00200E150F|nr:family 43 glycosylhydrolase [Paenibacillus hamazuiensis]
MPEHTNENNHPVPLLRGDYPDPSIVRVGSDYYMTHSSLHYTPGLLIWHSTDLFRWRPVGKALEAHAGNVYAPELIFADGRFCIYFPSNHTIYAVTAERPEGPWSDPVPLHIDGIDPGHLRAPDGKRYLYINNGKMAELRQGGLAVNSELRKVYDGWPIPDDMLVEGFCLESPKLLYKDGYYHMVSAQGGTAGPATSHMAVSSRSRSPCGPWEHSPYNPVVHTESAEERWWSKGHGTLVDTPDGRWYIVYHAYEKGFYPLGRMTLIEPVEWTEDGWFRLSAWSVEERKLAAELEELPNGLALSDDFRSNRLGLQWSFWKEHERSRYAAGDGVLRLKAKGSSPADANPLLCAPPDPAYEAQVEVSFGTEGAAGLVLFYNEKTFSGIAVSAGELIRFRRGQAGAQIPFDGAKGCIHLKLRNDRHTVTLYYSENGELWTRFPSAIDVSAYHHNAFGEFLSLRLGLYASGSGEAEFRDFRYTALG